ncbi:hypothetical protein BDR06DRAFT_586264 [Suillus hirtellus]|nr:hypothetical protein BDR06DRAFT_586264 [Suillus hirtellus]
MLYAALNIARSGPHSLVFRAYHSQTPISHSTIIMLLCCLCRTFLATFPCAPGISWSDPPSHALYHTLLCSRHLLTWCE